MNAKKSELWTSFHSAFIYWQTIRRLHHWCYQQTGSDRLRSLASWTTWSGKQSFGLSLQLHADISLAYLHPLAWRGITAFYSQGYFAKVSYRPPSRPWFPCQEHCWLLRCWSYWDLSTCCQACHPCKYWLWHPQRKGAKWKGRGCWSGCWTHRRRERGGWGSCHHCVSIKLLLILRKHHTDALLQWTLRRGQSYFEIDL